MTAEKRAREQRLQDRRKRKAERKAERKQVASEAREADLAREAPATEIIEEGAPDDSKAPEAPAG